VTCPDPTPGTLTNLSGAFGGIQASDLVDAYHNKDPYQFQWQWTTKLTNKPALDGHYGGGCARYRARQRTPGEVWLFPTLIGSRTNIAQGDTGYCPPPPTPITMTAVSGTQTFSADGLSYWTASVKFVTFGSNCREGKPVAATGGTITFTTLVEPYTWDTDPSVPSGETGAGMVEATLDTVTFPNGQSVSGSFVAPFCSALGCPAPPASWQCVT
jgi:hypothetical protein